MINSIKYYFSFILHAFVLFQEILASPDRFSPLLDFFFVCVYVCKGDGEERDKIRAEVHFPPYGYLIASGQFVEKDSSFI